MEVSKNEKLVWDKLCWESFADLTNQSAGWSGRWMKQDKDAKLEKMVMVGIFEGLSSLYG